MSANDLPRVASVCGQFVAGENIPLLQTYRTYIIFEMLWIVAYTNVLMSLLTSIDYVQPSQKCVNVTFQDRHPVGSMRTVCAALQDTNGGHTGYCMCLWHMTIPAQSLFSFDRSGTCVLQIKISGTVIFCTRDLITLVDLVKIVAIMNHISVTSYSQSHNYVHIAIPLCLIQSR